MIKTIKVKKTKNLSELIAYISVSGIKDANFVSNYENIVSADHSGQITTVGKFYNDTFTVEVEEVITEDTWFRNLIQIYETVPGNARLSHWDDRTTKEIINWNENENTKKVYALIENNLQLIWEAE